MKKRFRLGLALLLVCLTFAALTLCASAETKTGTCGDDVTYTLDTDTGVLTISGEGEMTSHPWTADTDSIRAVIIEDGVTSIVNNAFYSCGNLASVSIPDSMEVIETYAFQACKSLTEIVIPDSVTDIGSFAFYNCGLVKITIPFVGAARDAQTKREQTFGYIFGDTYEEERAAGFNNRNFVPQSLKQVIVAGSCEIPEYAFRECKYIERVTIADGVYKIGYEAFWKCTALTEATIADSVSTMGGYTFYACSNLTDVTLPNNRIGNLTGTFRECTALKYVNIPEGVTSIGSQTFMGCSNLASVTLPTGIISIKEGAFSSCASLKKIFIPNSVETIEKNAFAGCSGMTEISIPFVPSWKDIFGTASNNVDIIAPLKRISITGSAALSSYAFYNLRKLTDLSISANITDIDINAFLGCTRLKKFHVDANNPIYMSADGLLIDKQTNSLIYAASTLSGEYILAADVANIGESAFHDCETLRSIVLLPNVKKIEEAALGKCISLRTAKILNPNCEIYDNPNTFSSAATIYGFAGSTAEAYAKKYNRTFVALEPTTLTAKVSAATYANGTATLRVTATPTVTEGMEVERYGVFFAPAKYADSYATNGQVVVKEGAIASGKPFVADLTDIPESAYDVKIYAWAFVKLVGVSDLVVCPLDPVSIHDIVK